MSKPKVPKETPDQKKARLAEEERIALMQVRANAEEAAAGRQLLTRKTRMAMRIYGARRGMIGGLGGAPAMGGGTYNPGLSYAGNGGYWSGYSSILGDYIDNSNPSTGGRTVS